ncbi:hypothetical protein BDV12DRAFT_191331 [Aspergillus spectabilis]
MQLIATLSFLSLAALSSAQCPDPTASVTIEWPDDLYRSLEIMVSSVDSNGDTTTYVGVECPGNPYSNTIAVGPRTFSYERSGCGEGCTMIDRCVPVGGSGMDCTLQGAGPDLTTRYGPEDIYTVTMAVVSSGAENTALPTQTGPPYVGCPNAWQQCDDTPWCCPTTASICTTAPNSHEACASVHNEEFPGPALPYYSTMGPPPGGSEGPDSTDGAGPFAAQPTHLLLGGLAGVGLALL